MANLLWVTWQIVYRSDFNSTLEDIHFSLLRQSLGVGTNVPKSFYDRSRTHISAYSVHSQFLLRQIVDCRRTVELTEWKAFDLNKNACIVNENREELHAKFWLWRFLPSKFFFSSWVCVRVGRLRFPSWWWLWTQSCSCWCFRNSNDMRTITATATSANKSKLFAFFGPHSVVRQQETITISPIYVSSAVGGHVVVRCVNVSKNVLVWGDADDDEQNIFGGTGLLWWYTLSSTNLFQRSGGGFGFVWLQTNLFYFN